MSEKKLFTVTIKDYDNAQLVATGPASGLDPQDAMQSFLKAVEADSALDKQISYIVRVEESTDGGFPDRNTFTGTVQELLLLPVRPETVDGKH